MKKKPYLVFSIAIYICLLGFSLFAISYGVILPITTIVIYATLYLLATGIYNLIKLPVAKLTNIKLATAVILIMLCMADLGLRYLIKPTDCLSYAEQNGSWYYRTPTLQQRFNFLRLDNDPYKNNGLHTGMPNDTHIESKQEFNYKYSYNSLGMRDEDFTLQKPIGTRRIITLGDSFTEGIGAPSDSCWPRLLANMLTTDTTKAYQVLNAGAAGSDPYFELDLFCKKLLKYDSDIVLMAINSSDINEVVNRGGYERFNEDSTINFNPTPYWEPLYGASLVFRLVIHRVLHYNRNLIKESEEDAANSAAIVLINSAIDSMQQVAVANNFELIVIYHPLLREVKGKQNPLAKSIKYAQAQGINTVNLFEIYCSYFTQTNIMPDAFYWPIDAHHNGAGYLFYSRLLYAELNRQKLLQVGIKNREAHHAPR